MRNKSDVLHIVPRFFALVETQFSKIIKCFRSDNASELRFEEFLASKGTLHQFSCVHTPQQNSVVERKHQHLLNVARALMFQFHVPLTFWGKCVLTASYLINRTPMPLLSLKAPYDVLHTHKIDYSVMRVVGCLAYATTIAVQRGKFDPRATPCVFMGYPVGIKGYRLYDIVNNRFFISRDVLFFEDLFPFKTTTNQAFSIDHFDQFILPSAAAATDLISANTLPIAPDTPIDAHSIDVAAAVDIANIADNVDNATTLETDGPCPDVHTNNEDPCHDFLFNGDAIAATRRSHRPPSHLRDYHCNLLTHGAYDEALTQSMPHHFGQYVNYDAFTPSHRNFLLHVVVEYEPTFYHQAVKYPHWRPAMDEEIKVMERTNTWSVVPLPLGHHAIGSKWVYRVKYKIDGSVDRYKARLVAKGYNQHEGVDFFLIRFPPLQR